MDDRAAIIDLLGRYCHTLDAGDVDGAVALFAPDAVLWPLFMSDEPERGRDAIAAWYQRYWIGVTGAVRFLQHHIQSPMVDVDGDTARARCYLTATSVSRANDDVRMSHGRYEDVLVKLDGVWRFAERRIVVHYDHPVGGARMGRRPEG
jgi:uncharacterized protein (TIGR02246 family)